MIELANFKLMQYIEIQLHFFDMSGLEVNQYPYPLLQRVGWGAGELGSRTEFGKDWQLGVSGLRNQELVYVGHM